MQAEVASRCEQLHRRIDATADRAAFTDGPWTPTDLKEVVSLTLGC